MRLVIQRVTSASVTIAGKGVVGSIGKGACILIGIRESDSDREVDWATQTILEAKLWDDSDGRPWKESMKMQGYSVLLVSQFTLYGKTPKKGKLDFHHAMASTEAQPMYNAIVAKVMAEMGEENTQCGEFGANMQVSLVNDGPVTIIYDSIDYLKPLPPPKTKVVKVAAVRTEQSTIMETMPAASVVPPAEAASVAVTASPPVAELKGMDMSSTATETDVFN